MELREREVAAAQRRNDIRMVGLTLLTGVLLACSAGASVVRHAADAQGYHFYYGIYPRAFFFYSHMPPCRDTDGNGTKETAYTLVRFEPEDLFVPSNLRLIPYKCDKDGHPIYPPLGY